MKKSELRKLVAEYEKLQTKSKNKNLPSRYKIMDKIKEIQHRYYHETGQNIDSELN